MYQTAYYSLGRPDLADDYKILPRYFPNVEFEPITRVELLDAAGLKAPDFGRSTCQ